MGALILGLGTHSTTDPGAVRSRPQKGADADLIGQRKRVITAIEQMGQVVNLSGLRTTFSIGLNMCLLPL